MKRRIGSFWVLLFSFYSLTGTGHSSFSDGLLLLQTARSFLDSGSFAVSPPPPRAVLTHRKAGVDGQYYISYGPGLVFAHLPMLVIGRRLSFAHPEVAGKPADFAQSDEFWGQLTNAWITATAVVFVLLCGRVLGFTVRASLLVAATAAVASPLWLYAHIDSTEALQALSLIGAFYFLFRGRTSETRGSHRIAGLLLGIAAATKIANLVLFPWYVLYCLRENRPRGERIRSMLFLLLPAFLMTALVGLYNYVRFGSFLDSGYDLTAEGFSHPLWDGVGQLLVSPSYGLILFWPAFLLVLFGLGTFFRRFPDEAVLISGVFLTLLGVYAKWWAYWGLTWGPRFLVPAVPLLSLVLLPIFETAEGWRKSAILAAVTGGFLVQMIAVSCGYWTQVMPALGHIDSPDPRQVVQDPRLAPLRIAAWFLRTTLRERGSGAKRDEFPEKPPWLGDYAWRDARLATEDLRRLRGLDLWAAPPSLRLSHIYVPPPGAWVSIPSSRNLRRVLLAAGAFALFALLHDLRRQRAAPDDP